MTPKNTKKGQKTQKQLFLQNSPTEMAKTKIPSCHIYKKKFGCSGAFGSSPAQARALNLGCKGKLTTAKKSSISFILIPPSSLQHNVWHQGSERTWQNEPAREIRDKFIPDKASSFPACLSFLHGQWQEYIYGRT